MPPVPPVPATLPVPAARAARTSGSAARASGAEGATHAATGAAGSSCKSAGRRRRAASGRAARRCCRPASYRPSVQAGCSSVSPQAMTNAVAPNNNVRSTLVRFRMPRVCTTVRFVPWILWRPWRTKCELGRGGGAQSSTVVCASDLPSRAGLRSRRNGSRDRLSPPGLRGPITTFRQEPTSSTTRVRKTEPVPIDDRHAVWILQARLLAVRQVRVWYGFVPRVGAAAASTDLHRRNTSVAHLRHCRCTPTRSMARSRRRELACPAG